MAERKPLPPFANEAEEASWYFKHRNELDAYFGALQAPSPEERAQVQAQLPPRRPKGNTQHVPLRIPAEDVALAKALAAKRGIPYQTLLKSIIHQGLRTATDPPAV